SPTFRERTPLANTRRGPLAFSDLHAGGAQLVTVEAEHARARVLRVPQRERVLDAHERRDLDAGLHLFLVLVPATQALEVARTAAVQIVDLHRGLLSGPKAMGVDGRPRDDDQISARGRPPGLSPRHRRQAGSLQIRSSSTSWTRL